MKYIVRFTYNHFGLDIDPAFIIGDLQSLRPSSLGRFWEFKAISHYSNGKFEDLEMRYILSHYNCVLFLEKEEDVSDTCRDLEYMLTRRWCYENINN